MIGVDPLADASRGLPADPCQCCGWHVHADANGAVPRGATGVAYIVGDIDDVNDRWVMCGECWRAGYSRGETRERYAPKTAPTPRRNRRNAITRRDLPRRPPWSWTCLPCNVVGIGDSSEHVCAQDERWHSLRAYWFTRLRWAALRFSIPIEDIGALVEQPIERERIVDLLGQSWRAGELS